MRSFLLHCHLFWAVFSLVNLNFLVYLVVPFSFVVALPIAVEKFPFLMKPVVMGLTSSLVALMIAAAFAFAARALLKPMLVPILLAYVFNGTFLLVFLDSAEREKNTAILSQLRHADPQCVRINSFWESLTNAGEEFQFAAHALYKEAGKTYYWSYSTMNFFEGNPRLDPNFPCR